MKRLSHSDWAAISSALPAIYSQRSLPDLACAWMSAAKQLVSADLLMTSELDTRSFKIINAMVFPYVDEAVKRAPLFMELCGQIPEFRPGYAEGVLFGPLTTRMTQRRFERTDVYNAFHRPMGVRYQFAGFATGLDSSPHVGFVVQRRSRDYSERDTEVLRHLAQHYGAAVKNLRAFALATQQNVLLTNANNMAGQGIVFLTYEYQLREMTRLAATQLSRFFGNWRNRSSLPEPISRWLRDQIVKVSEQRAIGSPVHPLKIASGEHQLTIRLVLDTAEPPMLVISEDSSDITVETLRRFGLTPRETEVLYWLVQGKTNGEIAVLLGTREGTARKHVERILAHFGTPNRTATVLRVVEQLRSSNA